LYGILSYQPKRKLKKALPRAPSLNLEHHAHSLGNSSFSCLKFKKKLHVILLFRPPEKQASKHNFGNSSFSYLKFKKKVHVMLLFRPPEKQASQGCPPPTLHMWYMGSMQVHAVAEPAWFQTQNRRQRLSSTPSAGAENGS
jgi:hypothetical protein